jgi:lysophospholipase L1-like esterase
MAERKKRTIAMDNSTLRGRINIALSQLKNEYPTKQIILLTPIHRGLALLSDRNAQPDELHANKVGEYIDAYVNVVKEAGNVWAVPVIDLNSICGLYPLAESNGLYWRKPSMEKSKKSGKNRFDRLHPNSAGHLRMARALAYQLLGYPAKLD